MHGSETLAETVLLTRETAQETARANRGPKLRLRYVALVIGLAVALGLAGTAAPARAGDDDLVKALAALAIVGIIVHGLDQQRRPEPQPVPQPIRGPKVPAICALILQGQRGQATVYGENCLRQQGFAWRLPARCARPARIYGRNDRVFTAQCLREAGFRSGGV